MVASRNDNHAIKKGYYYDRQGYLCDPCGYREGHIFYIDPNTELTTGEILKARETAQRELSNKIEAERNQIQSIIPKYTLRASIIGSIALVLVGGANIYYQYYYNPNDLSINSKNEIALLKRKIDRYNENIYNILNSTAETKYKCMRTMKTLERECEK